MAYIVECFKRRKASRTLACGARGAMFLSEYGKNEKNGLGSHSYAFTVYRIPVVCIRCAHAIYYATQPGQSPELSRVREQLFDRIIELVALGYTVRNSR